MVTAYIGLGSNLAGTMPSPVQQVQAAVAALVQLPVAEVLAVSSLYQSKPVGTTTQQPDYINAVAELKTELSALALLTELQAIEAAQGRVRKERWGARTVDLDLLLYGHDEINHERLIVPHVELLNRAFVLVPLLEINPELCLPNGRCLSDYSAALPQDTLRVI